MPRVASGTAMRSPMRLMNFTGVESSSTYRCYQGQSTNLPAVLWRYNSAMVISGSWLVATLIVFAAWLVLLGSVVRKEIGATSSGRRVRGYLAIAGLVCSMVAVASLFALHLSWTSVRLSQHLGVSAIRIIAMLLFWPSLIGLVLCISGSGRMRLLGLATCLGTGFYWLVLSIGSAISMGAAPIARHP